MLTPLPSKKAFSTAKETPEKSSTAPASLCATGAKNPRSVPSCSIISRRESKSDSLLSLKVVKWDERRGAVAWIKGREGKGCEGWQGVIMVDGKRREDLGRCGFC